jgi:hypothetical protein
MLLIPKPENRNLATLEYEQEKSLARKTLVLRMYAIVYSNDCLVIETPCMHMLNKNESYQNKQIDKKKKDGP